MQVNYESIIDKIIFLIYDSGEIGIDAIEERLGIRDNLLQFIIKFLVDSGFLELKGERNVRLTRLVRQTFEVDVVADRMNGTITV
ncbi:MAG: hypothetical protein ACE5J2_05420 [Nitrososphaerales archaeon]